MKFVKFILCAAIFLGSVNCVYAAEDSGVTEALKQVKERVDTTEYDEFRSSYYKNDDGIVSYSFTWSKKDDDYSELYISFENGIITGYGKYGDSYMDKADAFSLTAQEAEKIADEFIKRINPDICGDLKIVPNDEQSIQSESINFDVYRTHNDIPILDENGYIAVSKNTHEVGDFYINYTQGLKFKAADKIISIDEAKEAYKKLMPPTLRYKYRRDYDKSEISAYLEYAESENGDAINAYDGSLYEFSYGGMGVYRYSKGMGAEDAAADKGLTPAELEETERVSGLLSEDAAMEIVKKNKYIALSKNPEVEYTALRHNWFNKDEYFYQFNFTDGDRYVSTTLDAKNGEILGFYGYSGNYEDYKPNKEKEEKISQTAFKELAGEKAEEFRLDKESGEGFVNYVRTVNGLDVIGDGAYFEFGAKENIESYSLRYTKGVEFPPADVAVSADKAAALAFSEIGFGLVYSIDYNNKTAEPVYCIGKMGERGSFTIDPNSGKLTDYYGEEITEPKKIAYTDIENHYGKDIFLALAQYGIGFAGDELRPDEAITQAEYVMLLNKAFGYDSDIDEIYKRMIMFGTMKADERADESALTREKAAILMIREMGAEEYAKYEDIYKAPFDDVTENKGYISILKAKGIINGDGSGHFYPQKTVTRGEALIMIYKNFTK